MNHLKVAIVSLFLALTSNTAVSETIRLEGEPMSVNIGYGIIINEGSSLQREALIIQDERLPVRLTRFTVKTAFLERNWNYKIGYSVELDAPITAIEVRFIPFSIWGEKDIPLSGTTIEDIGAGKWAGSGSWRLSENDAVQHYAMIGYIAQVKTSDGQIIKANPDLVVQAAQAFSGDFSTSDLKAGD